MSRLVDIKSEKFWDVLFDEACVEGSQAERIENDLNKISVSEQEIRNKAIDEFAEKMKELSEVGEISVFGWNRIVDEIADQMKGGE